MLDLKFVREHSDEVRRNIQRKKDVAALKVLDDVLVHDAAWRALKLKTDGLRAERNKVSEEINATKKAGGDASKFFARAKGIPAEIKELEEKMTAVMDSQLLPLLKKLPNLMHEKVPFGESADDNPTLKTRGEPKAFKFPVKNHVELAEKLGIVDFDASAKITGNGFYFLKGDLALLNQALIRYATDIMLKHKYNYVEPPLMVHKRILQAAMDENAFNASVYKVVGDDDLCLIGTAEHAILGMLENATLQGKDVPLRVFGYSMCFRQEIGAHGINERGLWRTHQFNKVEMFAFTLPEQSWQLYDEMLGISEEILQGLKLPYRVIECCTGDLAIWKARSFDCEVWRPTTKAYGEVMSLSNCTDFQARDLNIRYDTGKERGVVHTLNNTALATSRILVAILENYQNADGSVTVPTVLAKFMGKKKIV